jgi:uncharacterized protein YjbI with pentapeptide repeats
VSAYPGIHLSTSARKGTSKKARLVRKQGTRLDFQDAILTGADLSNAQLGGANLASVTRHAGATVTGARTDERTRGTWW